MKEIRLEKVKEFLNKHKKIWIPAGATFLVLLLTVILLQIVPSILGKTSMLLDSTAENASNIEETTEDKVDMPSDQTEDNSAGTGTINGDSDEVNSLADDGEASSNKEPTSISENTDASLDNLVDKADTSGMNFDFSEEDDQAADIKNSDAEINLDEAKETTSITSGGTYTLTGTKDTMIYVNAGDANVTLILNGVTIKNSAGPAIYVKSAGKVNITVVAGTTNTLSDGSSYSITDGGSSLDAALFSRADLTINGSGTLIVKGNYKHGIVSKDDLIVSSVNLQITSNKVGLNGKDCVKINSGTITIVAGSDGIRSDNDEDTNKGYIYLYGGTIRITAGNDGIQAETVLNIETVDLTVQAGGGSSGTLYSSDESYKGLKAGSDIYISGGSFTIDSKDDCIHSNGTVTISGGTYTLSSGDDGIHADTDLGISNDITKLSILKSYEGIEGSSIIITGGTISIVATDDGLNGAGGSDSSAVTNRPGQGHFTSSTGKIAISGGNITVKASGDGIDSNGTLSITGGYITVSGPNSGDTSILDFDSTGTISGGTFIGTGASGMTQNFSSSSTQGAIMITAGAQPAGTVITLKDSNGNVVLSYTADQAFSCVILSCSSITKGSTYTLTIGSSTMSITMNSLVYSSSNGGAGGNGGMIGGGNRW